MGQECMCAGCQLLEYSDQSEYITGLVREPLNISDPIYSLKIEATSDGQKYIAGLGLGLHDQEFKRVRPFMIVDGVVYLNSALIKENTVEYTHEV